jgi:hypothetical protein
MAVMPFLALIAWAAPGDSYQSVVIVLLMAAFYLLPGGSRRTRTVAGQEVVGPEHAGHKLPACILVQVDDG